MSDYKDEPASPIIHYNNSRSLINQIKTSFFFLNILKKSATCFVDCHIEF